MTTLAGLRRMAVAHSLFTPISLSRAIVRMGYVQADPIRAPARAQDLILRHRVRDYRIDDLERRYSQLDVHEDMLHNYGFFPQQHRELLYPRRFSGGWQRFLDGHKPLKAAVLHYLKEHGEAHPRVVEQALSAGRRTNGWGGSSSVTTMMMEALHRRGVLRVARREDGIRVYANALPAPRALSPTARADGVLRLILNLYAPMHKRSLMQTISMMGTNKPDVDYPARIARLVASGEWVEEMVDGATYLWPSFLRLSRGGGSDSLYLLAPFDPVAWDRRRFEHLWGWAYRFEAYTPAARRVRGYYALPMLWRNEMIGWANVSTEGKVEPGFIDARPHDAAFKRALADEIARLQLFLARKN